MNVSGIVVKTAPEHLEAVLENLRASGLCDVHFHDASGKIIVTVEGENTCEEVAKMKAIINISNVLSASLTYAYSENEMNEAEPVSGKTGKAIPDVLKD